MSKQTLSFREANAIPITEYLSKLGIEPIKVRGHDHWYLSPFRKESNPSFKVQAKLNLWFDHGTGEGGTLVDLGIKLQHVSSKMLLEELTNGNYQSQPLSFHRNDPPENKLHVLSVNTLENKLLLDYLLTRGITKENAIAYCKEVNFKISNRSYLAVGFQNRSGGYELRNNWFKGASSPKDITLISQESDKLCITEGFIDFLSLKETKHEPLKNVSSSTDFLILNSLSFLRQSEQLLREYPNLIAFFDNDAPGLKAKDLLKHLNISFTDASKIYAPHKDVNEFLQAQIKLPARLNQQQGKVEEPIPEPLLRRIRKRKGRRL